VTNDDDFLELSILKGFPPKVILLRVGNQKTKYIAKVLITHTENIDLFYKSVDYGVLEIY
jgi:predicted nuclease of predicted toxin-antitoxin system